MPRISGFSSLLCLCGLAALPGCTVNAPPNSVAYAPSGITSVRPGYETYTTPPPVPNTAMPPAPVPQNTAMTGGFSSRESSPLVVRDLTTRKVTIDGQNRLIIEGNIINVSPVSQTAAELYGKVLDAQNTVLRNLPIPNWSPVVVLPGASLHFRIDTPVPPPPAARVRVTVAT